MFLLVLAIIMLSVAFAYFINWNGDGLALHWAFLIVFGVYLLLAALLVFIGVRKVKQVRAPERAIEQGREIPKALQGPEPDAGPDRLSPRSPRWRPRSSCPCRWRRSARPGSAVSA